MSCTTMSCKTETTSLIKGEVHEHKLPQPSYSLFKSALGRVSDDYLQRTVLVEDLSLLLISFLGAPFQSPTARV